MLVVFATRSFASAAKFCPDKGTGEDKFHLTRALAVIWLNPLTYLEMFVIPATISVSLDQATGRVPFILGLLIMNTLCCIIYAGAGQFINRFVTSNRTIQSFDLASGVLLSLMAVLLARSQLT